MREIERQTDRQTDRQTKEVKDDAQIRVKIPLTAIPLKLIDRRSVKVSRPLRRKRHERLTGLLSYFSHFSQYCDLRESIRNMCYSL